MSNERLTSVAELVRASEATIRAFNKDNAGAKGATRPMEMPLETWPEWLGIFDKLTRSKGRIAEVTRPTAAQLASESYESLDSAYRIEKSRVGALMTPLFWAMELRDPPLSGNDGLPELRYSPKLQLIIDSARIRGLNRIAPTTRPKPIERVCFCDILNGFADEIRSVGASTRFRAKQLEFTKSAEAHRRWLDAAVDQRLKENVRPQFASLDLGYSPDRRATEGNFYAQIKEDAAQLCVGLRASRTKAISFHEFGLSLRYLPVIGFHCQLFLIYTSSTNEPGIGEEAVKGLWQKITKSGAWFLEWPCENPRDETASNSPAGLLSQLRRQTLKEQIFNVTQLDSLFRVRIPPKDQLFYRGSGL